MGMLSRILLVWALGMTLLSPASAEPQPFELRGGQVVFTIKLQGREIPALLDTGAGVSQISAELASELGLKTRRLGRTYGAAGKHVPYKRTSKLTLDLGTGRSFRTTLGVYPAGSKFADEDVEVLIGADLLRKSVLHLDFEEMTLDIRNSAEFDPPAGGLPLNYQWDAPTMQMSIAGKDVGLVLDTAASIALHLSERFTGEHPGLNSLPAGNITIAGMDGVHEHDYVTIPHLTMAGQTFEYVPASVTRSDTRMGPASNGGVAGVELLRRFDVTIDFVRHRAWLTPNTHVDAPFAGLASGAPATPP